jgi:glucose/mannose-6-phosphate isomerase
MDWEKLEKKYDKKDVLGWLRTFSDQCVEAVYIGSWFKPKKRKIENIVACGMGGSGVGAAILRNLLKQELKVPFEVFNSYSLPAYVGPKTLVFCVSFSGNTEETLECYREAKKKKAYVISLTTDGTLKKIAGKGCALAMLATKDCLLVPPRSPQPRMAIAYLCLPMLVALEKMKLVAKTNSQLNEMLFLLIRERQHIEAKAKEIALKMKGKLPIIYAPEELATMAYRFRTEINENAKQFAMSHFLPEQNHNEISARLGLSKGQCEIFLLRHENEGKRIAKRFGILKKIMGKHFNITEINLKGKSLLAVTFYALQLAALTAYCLALLNKLDPEPIPQIKVLKKELKKK